MNLAELFPDGDYRFHLTLRRSEPAEFFRRHDVTGRLLAERARWLNDDDGRCAAIRREGEPIVAEFAALATKWGYALARDGESSDAPIETVRQLGRTLEPDILFLSADADGKFRLRGGALCFPTGWALEEKIGHTLEFIHGIVPGLNDALAGPINQFLAKLKPGVAFLRSNWGIAASDELNLHPARATSRPAIPVLSIERLWLRVEHQALVALPQTGGIIFGIRIALHRLDTLAGTSAAAGLHRSLRTMPPEMIAYKRLEEIRPYLLTAL
jgi:hypothetical protein